VSKIFRLCRCAPPSGPFCSDTHHYPTCSYVRCSLAHFTGSHSLTLPAPIIVLTDQLHSTHHHRCIVYLFMPFCSSYYHIHHQHPSLTLLAYLLLSRASSCLSLRSNPYVWSCARFCS